MVTSLRGNLAPDKVEELTIVNKKGEKATWFKQISQYKFDKEEIEVDLKIVSMILNELTDKEIAKVLQEAQVSLTCTS